MTRIKKICLSVVAFILLIALSASIAAKFTVKAEAVEATEKSSVDISIKAKSALLMDYNTGKVVFEQNSKEHMPIASMVKIMTLNIVFEEIENGNLTLDTEVIASENATNMGGSQAFLDTNNAYKLDDLIKTIVVASANDSCVAVAEKISGSVESFVDRMNETAARLGMNDTNFVNCTGLPAPNQYSCANDVGIMTRFMLRHDIFYKYSKIWMFDFVHPSGRITELSNTNKLIRAYEGCDGGKTGFTNEAMYCLSATAKRGNTRLISVVMGAQTSKERNGENAKLFNHGFANFETRQLAVKGQDIGTDYNVEGGKQKNLRLLIEKDFYYFTAKKGAKDVTYEYVVNQLSAPISANQVLGEMKIFVSNEQVGSVNLVSDRDISKITYLDIIDDMVSNW